jgi:tRNA (cytidine/uridine-2'-O-)-methyltransferase
MPLNVVLLEPEIAPNTGNVARLCAVTGAHLHLIEPLGFRLTDKELKRSGMDYWAEVQWRKWGNWTEFRNGIPPTSTLWLIEAGGPLIYSEATFGTEDYLVFGRESAGLPETLLASHRNTWLGIPMPNPKARSLNLSNCAAIVLYEALRQTGFPIMASPQ